jgi:hypothetical protein
MRLFFQGGDVSDHRKRLVEQGVKNIAISFHQLEKRIKKTAVWSLADHFPDDVTILLDSGAYSASKKDNDWTEDDWRSYVDRYCEFVEANVERADIITEFDGVSLGREYIEEMRSEYWEQLDISSKFMPVWHEEHGGLAELERLSADYDRVAITNVALDNRRVMANRLNSLVAKYGVKLHGLAITKPDDIMAVKFDSVSSTSWVSPMRFGDTILWDGARLKRYPMKYKEKARKRNRRLIEKAGFDPDKIADDDPNEVVAISIWSWLKFEEATNRRKGLATVPDPADDVEEDEDGPVVATWDDEPEGAEAETPPARPATSPPEVRNLPAVSPGDLIPLPVLGFERATSAGPQGETGPEVLVARSTHTSLRQCDTCYVAANCPLMEPGSACKFSLPVEIRTKEQLMSAMQSVVEMQMQRVAFARYAEELEGGYPDQTVSGEIDRLFANIARMRDINDNRDFLKVQIETRGNAGVLSRLFGEQNVPKAEEFIDAQSAEEALGSVIEDAQVVD